MTPRTAVQPMRGWEGSGEGSDEGVEDGDTLERGVDGDVADGGEEGEGSGEGIGGVGEVEGAEKDSEEAEDEAVGEAYAGLCCQNGPPWRGSGCGA